MATGCRHSYSARYPAQRQAAGCRIRRLSFERAESCIRFNSSPAPPYPCADWYNNPAGCSIRRDPGWPYALLSLHDGSHKGCSVNCANRGARGPARIADSAASPDCGFRRAAAADSVHPGARPPRRGGGFRSRRSSAHPVALAMHQRAAHAARDGLVLRPPRAGAQYPAAMRAWEWHQNIPWGRRGRYSSHACGGTRPASSSWT